MPNKSYAYLVNIDYNTIKCRLITLSLMILSEYLLIKMLDMMNDIAMHILL